MKSIVFCFIASLTILACTKDGADDVHVRFINATDKHISDITVDNLPVGDMAAGSTSEYYEFDGFGTDTGLPDVDFIGTLDEKRVRNMSDFFWCGTEKKPDLPPGKYTVRVKLTINSGEPYFYLTFD